MSSSKPTLRSTVMAGQARSDLNNAVQSWALENADKIRRSCANCVYANKSGPFICSKYLVTPPLDVIMNGCDGHSDIDDIPF